MFSLKEQSVAPTLQGAETAPVNVFWLQQEASRALLLSVTLVAHLCENHVQGHPEDLMSFDLLAQRWAVQAVDAGDSGSRERLQRRDGQGTAACCSGLIPGGVPWWHDVC